MHESDTDQSVAHVLACERALLDPAVRHDRDRVCALLAEDFQEYGTSGNIWTRDQILDLLAGDTLPQPTVTDMQCRLLTPEVALVTYRTARVGAGGDAVAALRASIWIKDSAGWRVRFHQATRIRP